MSESVITVEKLGKKFRIGNARGAPYGTLRDSLVGAARASARRFTSLFSKNETAPEAASIHDFWALKDVSFGVNRGEVVGIIGRNGAGKSTLLKILSGITEPTEGFARMRGRVASLLEVGTGFHPELTGRENIFLNGAILGMKRAEIVRKFDAIVSFAEIESFLDTPVKRYSSGMYVRLAFAVAAHLEPDILIIDEVLAVGDIAFQKKCLGKMQDVATRESRTVLFVTHNMQAVRHMCGRALLIEKGRVAWLGDVATAIHRYSGNAEGHNAHVDLDRAPRHNSGIAARFLSLDFLDEKNAPALRIERGSELRARIAFEVREPIRAFDLAMAVTHSEGERVFSETYTDQSRPRPLAPGRHEIEFAFPAQHLKTEAYFLTLWLWDGGDALDFVQDIPLPEIVDPSSDSYKEARRWGVVRVPVRWTQPSEKPREGTAIASA